MHNYMYMLLLECASAHLNSSKNSLALYVVMTEVGDDGSIMIGTDRW